jgi:hypothetical protein
MQTANEQLLEFLKNNPKSNKAAITAATTLSGLFLFNLLKKLQSENQINSEGEGTEMTFSIVGSESSGELKESDRTEEEAPIIKPIKGRDNSKYKFNNEEYGKGPLVRAVVAKYVEDNPSVTHDDLKKIFPDELLKRFGIFQDEKTAKEIGGRGERYFFKPERTIKLVDRTVVVCNQFTFENIQPFLKVAKNLGYKIK